MGGRDEAPSVSYTCSIMRTNTPHLHPVASCRFARVCASTALVATLTLALSLGGILSGMAHPKPAFADDIAAPNTQSNPDTSAEPDALQADIERTAAAYDEAAAHVAELEQQIADNEAKISQLETDLPQQQERGATAMRTLYRLQQDSPGIINLILNATSLNDFLTAFEYVTQMQERNLDAITQLKGMQDELASTRASLNEAKATADEEAQIAESALAAAQAAREEAQRKAQEEAAAQAAAAAAAAAQEAAAAQAAQEQAAASANTSATDTAQPSTPETSQPSTSTEPVQTPTPDNADWSTDKATFVAEWSGRIDAYLSGSPLGGYGSTFAEAAWDYGVDPRWSPAISNTESTKGRYCANLHNAWGWGNISWDSWEEAIRSHVRGLANGYGYTISVSAAQKYCPPNWEHWYNATLNQMNII